MVFFERGNSLNSVMSTNICLKPDEHLQQTFFDIYLKKILNIATVSMSYYNIKLLLKNLQFSMEPILIWNTIHIHPSLY